MINQSTIKKLIEAAQKQGKEKEPYANPFDSFAKILNNFSDDSDSVLSFSKKITMEKELQAPNFSVEYSKLEAILSRFKNQSSTILKTKNKFGHNLLHIACLANNLKLIEMLIEFGVCKEDFIMEDEQGLSPILILLHHFNETSDSSILCYLFSKKILNIDSRYILNATLLHFAAFNNDNNLCQLLLLLEANVDATDENGNAPLHYASMQNSTEVAEALLLSNAQQKRNNKGETPADLADLYCSEEVLNLLASHKADACEESPKNDCEKSPKFEAQKSHTSPILLPSFGKKLSHSFSESAKKNADQQTSEKDLPAFLPSGIFRSISVSSSPTNSARQLVKKRPSPILDSPEKAPQAKVAKTVKTSLKKSIHFHL